STQIFGANAAKVLDAANTSKMATNKRLRSTCDNSAVNTGPNSITVKANKVTSCPAAEMETPRSRDKAGNSPTIRYSVVTITNAATARTKIDRSLREAEASPDTAREDMGNPESDRSH